MLVDALYNHGRIELAKLRPFFRVLFRVQVKIPALSHLLKNGLHRKAAIKAEARQLRLKVFQETLRFLKPLPQTGVALDDLAIVEQAYKNLGKLRLLNLAASTLPIPCSRAWDIKGSIAACLLKRNYTLAGI